MSVTFLLIPVAISALGGVGVLAALAESIQGGSRVYALSTRMRDPLLLRQALENYGFSDVSVRDASFDAALDGRRIVFQPAADGTYQVAFVGEIPRPHAERFVQDVDREYLKVVQQKVYDDLMARASARGLVLESEHFEEDNSVVLTFAVH